MLLVTGDYSACMAKPSIGIFFVLSPQFTTIAWAHCAAFKAFGQHGLFPVTQVRQEEEQHIVLERGSGGLCNP
jgi:hypothetical protein